MYYLNKKYSYISPIINKLIIGLFLFSAHSKCYALEIELIATDNTWLKLGHYKKKDDAYISDVKSTEFFLSQNGRTSPQKELESTISSFRQSFNFEKPDNHPICKFPARYIWLSKIKAIDLKIDPLKHCSNFIKWIKPSELKSISLILISGYLGNPASTFGHVLLKLNNDSFDSDLLNQAINYGAIVPEKENGVLYTLYGLFGGYEASFTAKDVFEETHIYLDKELRDMWEYPLQLNDFQVAFLGAHLWEIIGKKFDYYFIDENCAYHMGELIQLVFDTPITNHSRVWNIPSSLFFDLKENAVTSKPTLIPSAQRIVSNMYNNLSVEGKKFVIKTVNHQETDYSKLSNKSKILVSDTLISYFQYMAIKQPENKAHHIKHKKKWLLKRLIEPTQEAHLETDKDIYPPTQGHKPSSIKFNIGNNNLKTIDLSVSYHDMLSPQKGVIENTEFIALNFSLSLEDDTFNISNFTFIKLAKFSSNQPELDGMNPISWQLDIGFKGDPDHFGNKGAFFSGGIGKSATYFKHIFYAFVDTTISEHVHAGKKAKFYFRTGSYFDWGQGRTGIELTKLLDNDIDNTYEINIRNSYFISNNDEIRLNFNTNNINHNKSSLTYNRYF